MSIRNKKLLRNRYKELETETTEQLLERYAKPLDELDFEVIGKIAKARKFKLPPEHGAVSECAADTIIISAEQLSDATMEKIEQKGGVGFAEGISLFAGVGTILFTVRHSVPIAICLGAAVSVLLYVAIRLGRYVWRKLAVKNL